MVFLLKNRKRSDSDLAKLIILNDEKAFEELIKKYEAHLFSFCLGLIKDKTEAQDMVQETFFKFYRSIESLNPQKNVKSFLFSIARNLCIDSLRKKKPVYLDNPPEPISNETPFLSYCRSENEKILYAAIDELSETEKAAILLKYNSEMKYSEISVVINKSESAVESILVRAKKKLREKMQDIES